MAEELVWVPAVERVELLAGAVAAALGDVPDALVAEIDPDVSDTAAFCARYGVPMEASVNCVVVATKRGGETGYAACMVTAVDRADVNGFVRRHLGVRKASFAPMDVATSLTGMEYGGITPVGLPADWPVLVDEAVLGVERAVIGSGVRRSKLLLPGAALAKLPSAQVVPLALPRG